MERPSSALAYMGMERSSVEISSTDTRVASIKLESAPESMSTPERIRPVTPQQKKKGVQVMGVRKFPVWSTSVLIPTDEPGLLTGQVAM
jgi:hypothetical protein